VKTVCYANTCSNYEMIAPIQSTVELARKLRILRGYLHRHVSTLQLGWNSGTRQTLIRSLYVVNMELKVNTQQPAFDRGSPLLGHTDSDDGV